MAIIVTPARRRIAMAVLLAFAVAGALIRYHAPDPSTLRDIGTLLLVLWLPAVGNLVAWLLRKIPRRAPVLADFAPDAVFTPQLQVRLQPAAPSAAMTASVERAGHRCTLVVGRFGFLARTREPLAQALRTAGDQGIAVELLHPRSSLRHLTRGTDFHLLAGSTAVATGRVVEVNAG